MAAQSRPSANALLQPQARRRVSTLNFGAVLIIIGLVGAIVLTVIYAITKLNAPPADAMVNGGPVTQGAASPQDLGMGGSTSAYAGTPDQPIVQTVHAPIEKPLVQSTPTPMPAQASTSSSSASTAADDASAQRRETQRRAAEEERQQLEQERERTDTAMKSLGGVEVAEQRDTSPRSALTTTSAESVSSEYAAPSGPILALDTAIPVALTRSIDSTFAGSVPLDVLSDVRDETGQAVIIPAGSRCFATSSAGGVEGQDRIYVNVKLCKLPDRRRLVLGDFPVVDSDGATGVKARVDDHGAGRRNGGAFLPSLVGTIIPGGGIGESAAIGATSVAQQSQAGRAIPGPTLYVDASPQKPRNLSIVVTQDTPIGVHPSEATTQ